MMGRLNAFSLRAGDSRSRSWLRQILRYQLASETTHRAREGLVVLMAASSSVLWVAVAWPSWLDDALVRTALVGWAVLLVATLAALGLERRWLRLQQAALRSEPKSEEESR